MFNYPKFYKLTEFEPPEFPDLESIEARDLNTPCPSHKFHKWLYMPYEPRQKQYVFCLNCKEYSHT